MSGLFATARQMAPTIKCLDHGYVRLVDSMGEDLSIVRAARVSYDAAWRAGEDEGSDKRLIRYLWKNKHTSPFEAVEFQFEVKAPIFVFRQWHRHRTWSFNELSARYRELPEEFYTPTAENIGQQSKDNKQGRDLSGFGCRVKDDVESDIGAYSAACRMSFGIYRNLLAAGWPRELARSVLPVSTYSVMFAKVDLRNLLHFLDLRCHQHAQYEIRVYAEAMAELVRDIVPVAMAVWREHAQG
jgi:thymidylate synthase (FAD)